MKRNPCPRLSRSPEAEQTAPESVQTTSVPEWRAVYVGTHIRCEKKVLGQARALKGCSGLRSVLARLRATRVRKIGSKENQQSHKHHEESK